MLWESYYVLFKKNSCNNAITEPTVNILWFHLFGRWLWGRKDHTQLRDIWRYRLQILDRRWVLGSQHWQIRWLFFTHNLKWCLCHFTTRSVAPVQISLSYILVWCLINKLSSWKIKREILRNYAYLVIHFVYNKSNLPSIPSFWQCQRGDLDTCNFIWDLVPF